MNTQKGLILFVLAFSCVLIFWFTCSSFVSEIQIETANPHIDSISQNIIHPSIPDNLKFAGEEVPVWIDEVKERLENELIINTHWHSNTLTMMKMSSRWFPVFESVFDTMGIPEDFKYISLIESRLKNEVSPAGAAGFWHLMPNSAKEFGLYIDEEVDERYDTEKATIAAAKYFVKAKDKFGSWTNSAASYNRGMGGFSRAIAHQKVDNFYDLKLNDETARYVFRIIAVKIIFENPEKYGFYLSDSDYYQPLETKTIKVDSAVDWVDFAFENNSIYKYLRLYNPWIQDKVMKNKKRREYEVLLPKESQIYKKPHAIEPDTLQDGLDQDPLDKQE
jgi:hypothetical protein